MKDRCPNSEPARRAKGRLSDRLVVYAVRRIRAPKALPEDDVGRHIAVQMLRSGTLHHSPFCARARLRASAMLETAIVLPLYMIALLATIYFGYAFLSKQRQAVAGWYAACLPGQQQADRMLERFWPWEGSAAPLVILPDRSEAVAGDTRLLVAEQQLSGDPYYGDPIPAQLVGGRGLLGGGGDDCFDRERVAVSLWDYALGERTQSFVFGEGGLEERIRTHYDEMARFLNLEAQEQWPPAYRIGFIRAGEETGPQLGRYESLVAEGLNPGAEHWLVRRRAITQATYRPPFFKDIYGGDETPELTLQTYLTLQTEEPEYDPTVTTQFDVTTRGDGERSAVGEGASPDGLISDVSHYLGADGTLPPADEMDARGLGDLGTVRERLKAE